MVRHLVGIPLHYLQIDAHRTRAAAAVLAAMRCDRELDWQSHTLTCARFASTQLRMLVVVVYTVTGSSDLLWYRCTGLLMSPAACIVHPRPTGLAFKCGFRE